MDISKMDLQGLQLLHNSYNSVQESHRKFLSEEGGTLSLAETSEIEQKIVDFESIIQKIERRIDILNSAKLRFTEEFIFWRFGLGKRPFQVSFVVTSEA